jgi:hypothetical protein
MGYATRSTNEDWLMNVEMLRRNVMSYRGQEFHYEVDDLEAETDAIRQQEQGKTYRRKRSLHSNRKRTTKASTNRPGCGIGARRNRRWSW